MRIFQSFWLLFLMLPLSIAWAFSVFDIFRRSDLSGWRKAGWFAAVILLPWFGTLLYLAFSREIPDAQARAHEAARQAYEQAYQKSLATDQLARLASLHSQGELTDAEFASAKAHLLPTIGGHPSPEPIAPTH